MRRRTTRKSLNKFERLIRDAIALLIQRGEIKTACCPNKRQNNVAISVTYLVESSSHDGRTRSASADVELPGQSG